MHAAAYRPCWIAHMAQRPWDMRRVAPLSRPAPSHMIITEFATGKLIDALERSCAELKQYIAWIRSSELGAGLVGVWHAGLTDCVDKSWYASRKRKEREFMGMVCRIRAGRLDHLSVSSVHTGMPPAACHLPPATCRLHLTRRTHASLRSTPTSHVPFLNLYAVPTPMPLASTVGYSRRTGVFAPVETGVDEALKKRRQAARY